MEMTSDAFSVDSIDQTQAAANACPRDPTSRWKAFRRSLHPLRVIASKSLRGPYSRQEFMEASGDIRRRAAASDAIGVKTVGLWRLEKLGFAYLRHGEHTLHDAAIPAAIQPILHVGSGVAAMEIAGFSPETIIHLIESRSHPTYRACPYESIGFIGAVYANTRLQFLFRLVSQARIPAGRLPDWDAFIREFPPKARRLISHGYGRGLYFQDCNVGRSIRAAARLKSLDTPAAVQGIAFAYAMLNHIDIDRVLEVGGDLHDRQLARSFCSGLVYALVFWEWAFEGVLDHVSPRSDRQVELVTQARELTANCRQLGRLIAFGGD